MRDLIYHPDWDLFPLDRITAGAGIKMGKAANKNLSDYLWFWKEMLWTMKVQQQSYIGHDCFNISKT